MSIIAELEQYVANPDGALKFMLEYDQAKALLAEIAGHKEVGEQFGTLRYIKDALINKKPGTTGL